MRLKISAKATFLKLLPRSLAFGFLIAALLEPTFGFDNDTARISANNRNIMLLLDISKSMDATDIAPSRLARSKFEIKKLVQYFQNDKIGLICFAAEPRLFMPITKDLKNLEDQLPLIQTSKTASGTNLNDALLVSIEKLKKAKSFDKTANCIVLFTDGEDFSDITDQFFNDLRRYRIKLITVGIGTHSGSYLQNETGQNLLNKNGKPVKSQLEEEYLKSITSKCNGNYISVSSNNYNLSSIFGIINETKAFQGNFDINEANPSNKYHYVLLAAILLIIFDLIFAFKIFKFTN
jgi:Ca-activated chloride channel homolog